MAYCRNCGEQIDDKAVICPKCGVAQNQLTKTNDGMIDRGGFGWGALGFFVPIAGFVLYLVWKDTKPKSSKAAGIGALVSVICIVAFYLLYLLLIFIFVLSKL